MTMEVKNQITEELHLSGWKESQHNFLPKSSDKIKELYFKYKENILESFDDVKIKFNKYEVVFKTKRPFLYFYLGKDILKIWFNVKKGQLDENICRDVSEVGHWGVGDYELNVKDDNNFEYVMSLIRQTYELKS